MLRPGRERHDHRAQQARSGSNNKGHHPDDGICVTLRRILEVSREKRAGNSGDADNLIRIAHNVMGNTICPLGDAAALPVISFVTKFRSEFEEWIQRGKPESERAFPVTHIGDPAYQASVADCYNRR